MSNENSNSNSRKPDQFVMVEQPGKYGKKTLIDLAPTWNGKPGYSSGPSPIGRIVIQTREAREALQEMRKEEAQPQTQEQAQSQSQEH